MNIVIAADGWQHDSWFNGYYPEDLPEEWQLAYYANEFPAILIDGSKSLGELEEMIEECSSNFKIFLVSEDSGVINTQLMSHSCVVATLHFQPEENFSSAPGCAVAKAEIVHDTNLPVEQIAIRLSAENTVTLQEIRSILEEIMQRYAKYSEVFLFLGGSFAEMETLNAAKTMVELMDDR